jgi:hypothetical protein
MNKIKWILLAFGMLLAIVVIQGCTIESDGDTVVVDREPPAKPRGVRTVTGDGQVLVEWYGNEEYDLRGYVVYRSRDDKDYVEIAEVGSKVTSYIDTDVENGITYYYAVTAFDFDGNESELSPDVVDDTPRPAGKNVELLDYILEPDLSGFDFSNANRGPQPFDRSGVDIYFGVGDIDGEFAVPFIYTTRDDILIQDLGYTSSMDEIDASPVKGFTFGAVEAITGHTYCFLTQDDHYAKIRVTDVRIEWVGDEVVDAWVVFDWAYQLQVGNPELAPAKIGMAPIFGYKGGKNQ